MKRFTSLKLIAAFGLMMLTGSAEAQIVISKVFYAGTTKAGTTTNYTGGEEYIELHNNSANKVNIAGMYVGLLESESTTGAYLAKDREKGYEVKLKQVYQIPADKEYNVEPWANVVIAACAIDHSSLANGGADLSKADFEFGNMTGDNPDVPNLDLKFSFNASTKAVNLTNGGDASILIISKTNGDKYLKLDDASVLVYANGKDKGSQYLPFNAYYAMDAVEIIKTVSGTDGYAPVADRKRFSETQDKGYIPADQKMNKDGYIAYRKTALNCNGNLYLYDTDNSCVDFVVSNTIGMGQYDAVESGVTVEKVTIPESGFLPFNAKKYFFTDPGLYIGYVSISSNVVKFNSYPGNSVIANNSPYLLIGTPGEHEVKYSDAARKLSTAGQDNWIEDDNESYKDGVYTYTGTAKRYPMKFVNEKGNVRFVRDMVDNNPKSMKIDLEKEGRFFINLNYLNEDETVIKWNGITPEEVAAGISCISTVKADNNAVYNIQGVRMNTSNLKKGIYVKAGKKYVVK